jgi:hypothetical protein
MRIQCVVRSFLARCELKRLRASATASRISSLREKRAAIMHTLIQYCLNNGMTTEQLQKIASIRGQGPVATECRKLLGTVPHLSNGETNLDIELKLFLSSIVRILDNLLSVGPAQLVQGISLVCSEFHDLPTSIVTKQITGFLSIVEHINVHNANRKWVAEYGSSTENHLSKRGFFTKLSAQP